MAPPELLFAPLGGVGEIGMNLALYGVREGNKTLWLMVDCGITFAEGASLPGIEVIMPDIDFAVREKKRLAGLVLTHGHEDHIGAILDLWPHLRCKIYATPFTAGLIAAKAAEEQGVEAPPVTVVPRGGRIKLGSFDVEFIPVAHSIPETHALALRTPAGRVLHTGDWKLDPTPPFGEATDLKRMAAFGAEGVDAIIADSTNAVREGRSPSEADVAVALKELVRTAPARVAVTLFASNIGRVHSIAAAAQASGRAVVLLGRALQRNVTVARELGYLAEFPPFLGMDAYERLPPDRIVAIMTGSQGEERSMLARVARRDHPRVSLAASDRVIFSSRVIPGNERGVGVMFNGLVEQGVEIVTDRTHLVHVSGHPRADEMRELYDIVKPRALVPVHGEPLHLDTHARLARAWGIPEVKLVRNGDVARLAPGPTEVVGEVDAGRLLKDGKVLLNEAETAAVAERRRLLWAGIVSLAVALTEKGEIAGPLDVQMSGVPESGVSGESLRKIVEAAVLETIDSLPKQRRRDRKLVEDALARAARGALDEEWGKKPVCHVAVMIV